MQPQRGIYEACCHAYPVSVSRTGVPFPPFTPWFSVPFLCGTHTYCVTKAPGPRCHHSHPDSQPRAAGSHQPRHVDVRRAHTMAKCLTLLFHQNMSHHYMARDCTAFHCDSAVLMHIETQSVVIPEAFISFSVCTSLTLTHLF